MTEEHLQRRLATILAADVFGYSRLTAENEEETLRTLKAYRAVIDRLIARHEGRIFNTAGDSVLAEFGSAVEAVRCAITIQEELRVRNAQIDEKHRMYFRIGVNVGDVLVDGGNLYGDGVNIAARLESIATPGSICISGSVFSLVKNKLSYGFEDIGLQTVKNIPEPVPAFRLAATSTPQQLPPRKRGMGLIGLSASAIIIVCLAGAAVWLFGFGGWRTSGPPRVATASRPAVAKLETDPAGSATSSAAQGFDGVWEFAATGGEFCPLKAFTFRRQIRGGFIIGTDGRKIGNVETDGSFRFSNPSVANPSITVESQGNIGGDAAQGSYVGVGTACKGTYQIRLVQRF